MIYFNIFNKNVNSLKTYILPIKPFIRLTASFNKGISWVNAILKYPSSANASPGTTATPVLSNNSKEKSKEDFF